MSAYQKHSTIPSVPTAQIVTSIEALARQGAQQILERALAAEVDAYLGRARYERTQPVRGYRNGYARPREIGIGTWPCRCARRGWPTCQTPRPPSAAGSCRTAASGAEPPRRCSRGSTSRA